ncbi:hypothetical protein VP424E501_P0127 [Vibrio phage 424E50-1]|nr:hypothetical protein VP424E501_P0127 [Vibrio phage 424E50-1]
MNRITAFVVRLFYTVFIVNRVLKIYTAPACYIFV